MHVVFNFNKLLLICFFLMLVLPATYIKIGILLHFAVLLSLIAIFAYFIIANKDFMVQLSSFIKKKYTLFLIAFCAVIVISGFFLSLFGIAFWKYYLRVFLGFLPMTFCPFFIGFFLMKNNCPHKIIKLYTIIIFTLLLIGTLQIIIYTSGIEALENLYNYTFVNLRFLKYTHEYSLAVVDDFPRAYASFTEPCQFALFLAIHLPLIYNISTSKIKIFKNNMANKLFKKTFPVYAWIMLIAALSPINIIWGIIISFIYIVQKKSKNFVKAILITLAIACISIIGVSVLLNSNTEIVFLKRIVDTLKTFGNFNAFVVLSPSLATRIVSFINQFIVFTHYPLFGVGYGSGAVYTIAQLFNSPVPLTRELSMDISNPFWETLNVSILWRSLMEFGIIGTFLFYYLFCSIINKTIHIVKQTFDCEKLFWQGILYMLVCLLVLSAYDSDLNYMYLWGAFGLVTGYNLKKTKGVL